MLTKRATLALFATRALFSLASPVNSFTIQVTVQDSGLALKSDDTCGDNALTAPRGPEDPEVKLDAGTFIGTEKGNTHQFLGIPFAYPPTGDRRLRQPEALPPYEGYNYIVQRYGNSCPQQAFTLPEAFDKVPQLGKAINGIYSDIMRDAEDCLTVNVVKPADANPDANYPVLVWIYGGGFEIGGPSTYDGGKVVERSIELKQPVIYVSINYRLSALGFLPGRQVKDEKVGNLGLQDQRVALRWVQKYISKFGGDPSKVTIWGESAGAISVAMQMITNKGNNENLFRGGVMQSGGPIPVGDIENGQRYYDFMVEKTGCKGRADTLDCLRKVPYATYKKAMDESPNMFSYQALMLAWLPRVDGVFLTEPPQHSVIRGNVANVPIITGNCDDEGSLFSFSSKNVTTNAELKDYMKQYMMWNATDSEIDLLLKHYPDDQRAGSPFDTGYDNAFSPQFKRIAALQGDFVFHSPRRLLLERVAGKQKSWGFIHKRGKDIPFAGAFHGSDLVNSFAKLEPTKLSDLLNYIIWFTNKLDPNGDTRSGPKLTWPQWDPLKPKALIFQDDILFPRVIGDDNYRTDAMQFMKNISLIRRI
ncbi:carotenoid ester lipase precursor [Lactarius akahatsu]|uniref:Carboxylic ester hydrolase n=1 Tax=Lactarius akahatsu TaxID=416441 RepID=A0AAD4L8M8_9AGAM|nr:carotenoid ester lipase precursor [Lactarius akahatsu]